MFLPIRQLPKHLGQEVWVRGWVGHRRKSGKIRFMTLRDGEGYLQLVFSQNELSDQDWKAFGSLKQESSVEMGGVVRKEDRAPGGVEVLVKTLRVVHIPNEDFPISHKTHGPDFLLANRHLWLRSKRQTAILRLRHVVSKAIREFLDQDGFIETPTPILTANACEGTTTLFSVPYFDLGDVYLSQSGQLYGEALAAAAQKIYTFAPAFRAERSKTRKHLTEFWMVEPEMCWFDHAMNTNLIEHLVRFIVQRCLEQCRDELEILERDCSKLEASMAPFKRITYSDALEWLNTQGHQLSFGDTLGAEHEAMLGRSSDVPVFVTHYPVSQRAFYMKVDPNNPNVVLDCDLIAPEGYGEVVGGSQREERIDVLLDRIKGHQLDVKAFQWYLDLRRFGSVPHSGFGLGIERTVAWIGGVSHIRECIAFPRMIYRVEP